MASSPVIEQVAAGAHRAVDFAAVACGSDAGAVLLLDVTSELVAAPAPSSSEAAAVALSCVAFAVALSCAASAAAGEAEKAAMSMPSAEAAAAGSALLAAGIFG